MKFFKAEQEKRKGNVLCQTDAPKKLAEKESDSRRQRPLAFFGLIN